MKLCIFSDIHGNFSAAQNAFRRLSDEKGDAYICLGDICGYYFETIHVFEEMIKLPNLVYTLGNHDKVFLDSLECRLVSSEYTSQYGPSLEMLYSRMSSPEGRKFAAWLGGRPTFVKNNTYLAVHGSPDNHLNNYIYPNSKLPEGTFPPFVFMGHTHYPMMREYQDTIFLNPGSVGQPRHGGLSTYAVVETTTKKCEIKEFSYDIESFSRKLRQHFSNEDYLLKVLLRCNPKILSF